MSGYSNNIEAIAWFNAYIVDGCNTEPVPANWDQYLYEAKAYYAIAHGADAEAVAYREVDIDEFISGAPPREQR